MSPMTPPTMVTVREIEELQQAEADELGHVCITAELLRRLLADRDALLGLLEGDVKEALLAAASAVNAVENKEPGSWWDRVAWLRLKLTDGLMSVNKALKEAGRGD